MDDRVACAFAGCVAHTKNNRHHNHHQASTNNHPTSWDMGKLPFGVDGGGGGGYIAELRMHANAKE